MFGPNRQQSLRILPEDGREPETGESTGEHIFFDHSDPASRERAEELVRARFGVEIGELLSSETKREPLMVRWRKLFRRAS